MQTILRELKKISPPRIVREALALYGTTETPNEGNNPIILAWAIETLSTSDNWYSKDSTPWCGLFMGVVAQRATWTPPSELLRALSWQNFGNQVELNKAVLGDVLVFTRPGGGHVGLYVGENKDGEFFVLGGNQSDRVNIAKFAKSRLVAVRRPPYRIGMPDSAKKYIYDIHMNLSVNEA
jgi:uncharacterized protein (TIGR02594 family)